MAQYIYTMNRVSKMVPPKREILKDISLSFFPGAKIGVLGLNGAGKSTLLRIMAGVDKDFSGEARAQPGIKIGYLEQEPPLDPTKDVRGNVEDGVREALDALARLDEVFAEYAAEDADFDALAKEQEKLEAIIQTWDAHNLNNQLEQAAAALNLPAWDADVTKLSGGERRRVALCRLLLSKPDMLLLDEPTNHLDASSVAWLERFKSLNTPDPSYHGVNYVEALGEAAFIARARVVPLRNTGAAISPHNVFLILQGLETLSLRMERHTENAQKVAEYLQQHPKVKWVNYAGLKDHPQHALAQKYVKGKPSAILSFGVQDGREGGTRFIDALQLFTRLVNIGDAKSLACHPATTTHRQLNADELKAAGVSEDMVRLSIGIEHADDLIADLEQALAAV